jgi:aspartyl/asparaginyl-tRNA synthetase
MIRIHSRLMAAYHDFFLHGEHAYLVDEPTLTTSSCEGGCDVMQIVVPGSKNPETDFFDGQKAYLTVSAQLQLETHALALGYVWIFLYFFLSCMYVCIFPIVCRCIR